MEEIAEVTQLVLQETQIVDFPVPQIMEEIVEREQITPQERVQSRTVRSWTCPLPRFRSGGDPVDSTGARFRGHP